MADAIGRLGVRLAPAEIKARLRGERWHKARRMRPLYLLFLLPLTSFILFHYLPIYGLIIAFKDFRLGLGFWRSPWVGLLHFQDFLTNPFAGRIIRNTIIISGLKLLFGFPAPILLALLVNEIGHQGFKKTIQSLSYLPHFMSWVILAGIMVEILSPQRGLVAIIASWTGGTAPNFLTDQAFFRPMLIVTEMWKEVGWQSVVYLAALSSISPQLYESAAVDGANRFRQAIHITIPALFPVITILGILRVGNILNAGFDQIFNLYNPLVYEVADIIDTFVYRRGIVERQYDFAAAVGLFKSAIGVTLIVGTNAVVRRFSDQGIW